MGSSKELTEIQAHITNTLDPAPPASHRIAGVLGDSPSHYSKSPALWNAAFRQLEIQAYYVPFDVKDSRLEDFVSAVRDCAAVMGINVTVPYKVKVMELLDEIDPAAKRIDAVNTVVRTDAGRLIGYNTDGEGFLDSVLTPQSDGPQSFMESLKGLDVLILGAGGSARAVAFHLADQLDGGELYICNRTFESAQTLSEEIQREGKNARAINEDQLPFWAPKVDLIINSTTKGRGGIQRQPHGGISHMEPYSALAPAHPALLPESEYGKPEFYRKWLNASLSDIETNNRASLDLASAIPVAVAFCDLIYFPEETVFLRHGKTTGHRTLNGKGMIVCQAAIAFCRKICQRDLQAKGLDNADTQRRVRQLMYAAW